jgi:hypothetical protein
MQNFILALKMFWRLALKRTYALTPTEQDATKFHPTVRIIIQREK